MHREHETCQWQVQQDDAAESAREEAPAVELTIGDVVVDCCIEDAVQPSPPQTSSAKKKASPKTRVKKKARRPAQEPSVLRHLARLQEQETEKVHEEGPQEEGGMFGGLQSRACSVRQVLEATLPRSPANQEAKAGLEKRLYGCSQRSVGSRVPEGPRCQTRQQLSRRRSQHGFSQWSRVRRRGAR